MLARVGQHSSQLWAWVVAELVSLAYWGYLPQVRGWSQLFYVHALRVGLP